MGKKAKKWKSRAVQAGKKSDHFQEVLKLRSESHLEALQKIKDLKRHIENIEAALQSSREIDGFKIKVRSFDPFNYGSQIYVVQVQFDVRAITRAIYFSQSREAYDMTGTIHHLSRELCYKVEREIIKQLTEDKVLSC